MGKVLLRKNKFKPQLKERIWNNLASKPVLLTDCSKVLVKYF